MPCFLFIKVSCFPFSATTPFFRTTIKSAFLIVDSLCATTMVLLFTIAPSSAHCTNFSDSASRALVASSSSKIFGSFTSARAIATRCFCPPDNWIPLSPTTVSYPCVYFKLAYISHTDVLMSSVRFQYNWINCTFGPKIMSAK